MNRVTDKILQARVDHLNVVTGQPADPYGPEGPNAGNYNLSHAYGGVALHRMTEGGGERDVLSTGHVPKRELYGLINAYMDGMDDWRRINNV